VSVSKFSSTSLPYPLNTQNLKIGIAVSEWNSQITSLLSDGAITTLLNEGLKEDQICNLTVPGAFELPLTAKLLLDQGCDAVICLGCVVRGETPHFDYVCKAASDGILQIGLNTGKPVIFGVLTTDNEAQAYDRCGGKHGHKGEEAAQSAIWMLALKQHLANI
jgi:6,7-dimethyl-8-ribityllumazine synthase